jgi:hypothetical protein
VYSHAVRDDDVTHWVEIFIELHARYSQKHVECHWTLLRSKQTPKFFRLLGFYAALCGFKQTFRCYLSIWPLKMEQVVPKHPFQTTSHRVITQKTEEFSSTAAEAIDLAQTKNALCWGHVRLCLTWWQRLNRWVGQSASEFFWESSSAPVLAGER